MSRGTDDDENIDVRLFRSDDLDTIRSLFGAYYRWLDIDLTYQKYEDEVANLPGAYDPACGGRLLLAVRRYADFNDGQTKEEVLGCVGLRSLKASKYSQSDDQSCCELKRLYVAPQARKLGCGARLVEAVLEEARSMRYDVCFLDTLPTMKGAIHLYTAFGFRQTDKYYDTPIEETLFFAKTL